MESKTKLYRLLRDDEENPLENGVTAKLPLADETPLHHIRHGSRTQSQWISTSRSLDDVKKLIRYKILHEGRKACRVVEIDEQKLVKLKKELNRLKIEKVMKILEILQKPSELILTDLLMDYILTNTTGKILDFTDESIMNTYIPNQFGNMTARGYAEKYSEVLVERYIPSECCTRIHIVTM
ncbi:uncharacterized protein LOC132736672 [Ruditapes philippinarum]|uniref:uncharacterized protein LOC132736672 n=1 Tax=Ruditapes philippinarum TaxID=129788 RepID=UPI00295AB1BB|nr:uncharacterized protein LOC132736672 [Ruditapes philippinarum]